MKFIDLNYKQFKTTDIARCLKARYTAAPTNHTCEDSSVLIGGGNMKYSPTLNDDSNELAINVIGNYSPSNHNASRVVTTDGIAPTVMENHGTVTAVVVNEPKVIDALYKSREPRESDICPTLRSERTGLLVKESLPMDYDEQDNTLCTDGTVGTLTTDGSSPKHNNRVIVGGKTA